MILIIPKRRSMFRSTHSVAGPDIAGERESGKPSWVRQSKRNRIKYNIFLYSYFSIFADTPPAPAEPRTRDLNMEGCTSK